MQFYTTVNNKICTLPPTFVEINQKMTNLYRLYHKKPQFAVLYIMFIRIQYR